MPISDHPKYADWSAALDRLLEVKDAFRDKVATQAELDKARADLEKMTDELSA